METKKTGIGIFVICGLVLFGIGMFLIGDQHQLFAHHIEYFSEFANLAGLTKGAKVRVGGMDAGEVLDIGVPDSPSSQFRVKWRIDAKMRGLMRSDSVATIETEGVVGGTYLLVRPGSAQGLQLDARATIPSKEPTAIADLIVQAQGLLKDAQGTLNVDGAKLGVALDTVTSTVSNVNDVVAGIKDGRGTAGMLLRDDAFAKQIREDVTSTTSNVRGIVADLKEGRGVAGMVLRNEALAGQVRDVVQNAQQASANLNDASRQANSMVADFNSRQIPQKADTLMNNLNNTVQQVNQVVSEINKTDQQGLTGGENIRETLTNANAASLNLAESSEALKHNFFLRGFFKKRGYYNLADMTPEKYRKDKAFTSSTNRRVWFSGSDLFQSTSNGQEELSPKGKALLNTFFAEYGESIINSPLVIEGYQNGEVASDQLRLSRSRAMAVRQYLQMHFQLDTGDLGVVPLKNTPPIGVEHTAWDGVCIVLLKRA